jgi:hypothetical protein
MEIIPPCGAVIWRNLATEVKALSTNYQQLLSPKFKTGVYFGTISPLLQYLPWAKIA